MNTQYKLIDELLKTDAELKKKPSTVKKNKTICTIDRCKQNRDKDSKMCKKHRKKLFNVLTGNKGLF